MKTIIALLGLAVVLSGCLAVPTVDQVCALPLGAMMGTSGAGMDAACLIMKLQKD